MNHWLLPCLLLGSLPLLMCTQAAGQESKENMKAYPEAEAGMARYVLHLDPQEDESLFRIQLLVGQTVTIDEVNRYFFAGELLEESIEGWGFPKYTLKHLGPLAGTRVAVDPDAPKVKRFISLGGEPSLFRYNSRLPLVVYVPEDVEVRFRIWKTEPESTPVPRG